MVAVTLLGLAARGVALGRSPLWSDEAFMGELMRRSFREMITVVHNDNHPPLQYLLVRGATALGNTPVTLRLPSVLAGAAAVPVAMALGRRLGGDRAGIASGGLVALMPLLVLWSRDARMYALATTMVLVMALALWRAVENPTRGRVAVYGLTVLVGLYSHYLVALAVPMQLLAAALFLRPRRRVLVRLGVAAAAAAAALAPWLLYALPQFRHAGEPYWSRAFSIPGVATEVLYQAGHPGPTGLLVAGTLLGPPLLVLVSVAMYRSSADRERRGLLYVLGCGGLSLLVLFVVSLKRPLLDERFLNLYTTQFLPVAGLALAWGSRRWLIAVALVALLGVTATEVATLPTPEVPAVTSYLNAHVDPSRDVVALAGPRQYFPILYYGNTATRASVRVVNIDVHWYDGLAGFRAGDLVPAVPDAAHDIYLVTNADQADPPMPGGVHRTARTCSPGICLETWTH
ncbi:MAG: glycosyltransferase family 39 protein [Candidatus Dormibacteraeota bacterium]|nr:glycosyltransferase family 39 protein [Candidatus Dormibacteraeota bacterium]